MKTTIASNNETERGAQTAASWPECVEESYEHIVATITNLVAGESVCDFIGARAVSSDCVS